MCARVGIQLILYISRQICKVVIQYSIFVLFEIKIQNIINMGLAIILKSGRLNINSLDKFIEIVDSAIIIPYEKISPSDWGYIYEKFVGQTLEDEGYEVQYNGLNLGYNDRGIDLFAQKDSEITFVQCKYSSKIISKQQMEWILYKSSNLLLEKYLNTQFKISFLLVVNNKSVSFSRKIRKGVIFPFTPISNVEFPVLQYFLDHNYIQDKVHLKFREIEMIR